MAATSEDEYARLLLEPLAREPAGPVRVDVGRAIADGRRIRRTRRTVVISGIVVGVVLAAIIPIVVATHHGGGTARGGSVAAASGQALAWPIASLAAQPSAPSAPISCALQQLRVPAKLSMTVITGADPTGRYLLGGSYAFGDAMRYALIWDNGRPIPVDGSTTDLVLYGINPAGLAVGQSSSHGANRMIPVAYLSGKVIQLAGGTGYAKSINRLGLIVGDLDGKPVAWPTVSAAPVFLRLPASGWYGGATGVDEDGTAVGTLMPFRPPGKGVADGSSQRAYLWLADGTARQLPLPTIDGAAATWTSASYIRHGWVTGAAGRGQKTVGVLWNARSGEIRIHPQAAGAVNGYGWHVGGDDNGNPLLITGSGVLKLPVPVVTRQPFSNIAMTLSDDGRTIGGQALVDAQSGQVAAVVWHCK